MFRKYILNVLFFIITVILVTNLPKLFFTESGIGFQVTIYLKSCVDTIKQFSSLNEIVLFTQTMRFGPLTEVVANSFRYSITLIIIALLIIIVLTSIFTIIYVTSSVKVKRVISRIINIFKSIPDLLLIASLQIFSIFVYQKTNVLLFSIVSFGDEIPYFIPSVALSFVPTLFLLSVIITLTEEEFNKQYVEVVRAKGFSNNYIFQKHIIRNLLPSLSGYIKNFYALVISNLFIVELFFGIKGLMSLLKMNFNMPIVYLIVFLIISIPYVIISIILKIQSNYRFKKFEVGTYEK